MKILLYIDPGTGSLLFQLIISGIVSLLMFYKKIVSILKFKFGNHESDDKNIDNNKKMDRDEKK